MVQDTLVCSALFPTWLGMFFVVAFGSCLDVAAISLDMGQRLDYNHELKTVSGGALESTRTGTATQTMPLRKSYGMCLTVCRWASQI